MRYFKLSCRGGFRILINVGMPDTVVVGSGVLSSKDY